MLRILLILGTNIAIIALISVTFRILGLDDLLAQNGVDLDMQALLVYSAVIGFSGSLIFANASYLEEKVNEEVGALPNLLDGSPLFDALRATLAPRGACCASRFATAAAAAA